MDYYIKTTIKIEPVDAIAREILIAQLSQLGYDSFMETDSGVEAYISSQQFSPINPENLPFLSSPQYRFSISTEKLEEKNWNIEWEKNYFKPVIIDGQCLVRSTFHEAPSQKPPYEILINPQMSFGTGHHETTTLMVRQLLKMELKGMNVLDMGCGTAILSILASLRGASKITAIDIDSWATQNAIENLKLNKIANVVVEQGDASCLNNKMPFNLILANINRNIILHDMPIYDKVLKNNGYVLLSGFFNSDFEQINKVAKKLNWQHISTKEQNNWIALSYRKNITGK